MNVRNAADHGEHQPEIPKLSGTQSGAKLRKEEVKVCQTQSQRTIAQKGIILLRQREIGECFISADIQCAQGDRLACKGLKSGSVGAVLFFLSWQMCCIHIEEFCAEEPGKITEGDELPLGVVQCADIHADADADAIGGCTGMGKIGGVALLLLQIVVLQMGERLQSLLCRIRKHSSAYGVNKNGFAVCKVR